MLFALVHMLWVVPAQATAVAIALDLTEKIALMIITMIIVVRFPLRRTIHRAILRICLCKFESKEVRMCRKTKVLWHILFYPTAKTDKVE